ncbi:MAG: DUF362 domain-containing protein [Fuerstiella sp.]|nr:DUF362 domain-containing protein [Fuerstiella sp.]
MGAVYEEFKRELAIVRKSCAGDPRREMIQLFLMALEREELVSVGYRESLMQQRITSMPLPDDVQRLIRHTLIWIWKDEEMHTIYIRGAILKLGGWRLRTQAFLSQAAGGIGGWAGSVMQHSHWSRAPVSRLAATIVTAVGCLVGKVPADVKQHLQFGPFRNFCQFNIDAEQTAAVCWYRIAELAESQPDLDRQLARDFKRVAEDEDRHCRIFEILTDALGDDDHLVENETVESLVEKIREVGDEFLPRDQRRVSDIENPIGSGQVVSVISSEEREAKRDSFRQLLDECGLSDAVRRRARFLKQSIDCLKIAIKPTFMLGYDRKDLSPLTDPELVDDLAAYLRELGCSDITVVEGRNIYDRFFDNRSVQSVAEHFGFRSQNYRVVDTEEEQVQHQYSRGMAQYTIAKSWRDAEFRISFPKLRSHPIEMALLCVGNIEWVGGRCDEYLFLERQADRATAVMMLLNDFPPHFGIVDAFENAPDGLVGVMGCKNPVHPLRFYAGRDALAVDTVALQHVGVQQFQESSLLRSTSQWFGGAANQLTVAGENSPIKNWRGPYHNELRSFLSIMAYPMYVMGSGRGSLFLPEMDPLVFPLIDREKFFLRNTRRLIRWLLCLNISASRE